MGRRQPEKVIQAQIAQFLCVVGAKVYTVGTRRPAGDYPGTRQTPGLPDLIAFVPDRWKRERGEPAATLPLVVECKVPGGRLRPEQAEFRVLCATSGVAHVVGGLDEVIAWLVSARVIRDTQVPHYRLPAQPSREV